MGLEFNIDNYLRLSWQDILLTCLSTLIIILIARHFFWKKLLAFIEKRKELINTDLETARQQRNEAYKLRNDYARQMDSLKEESAKILAAAKAQADRESKRIVDQAREKAIYIEQSAREDMEREREKNAREMEEAISDVSFAIASKVLQEQMDETKARNMIHRFIEESERPSP